MAKTATKLIPYKVYKKTLKDIVEGIKTVYVYGGWGQPLTEGNKNFFIKTFPQNQSASRKAAIMAADANTFAMDCFCGPVKSVIDGFNGDPTKPYGGATYGVPCNDLQTLKQFLADCTDVSTDMSKIHECEILVYKDYSHCGVYVGDGLVVEATYNFDDGVQFTRLNQAERKGKWYYHGKMSKYIDYTDDEPTPAPTPDTKAELKSCIVDMMATLSRMNDIVNKM